MAFIFKPFIAVTAILVIKRIWLQAQAAAYKDSLKNLDKEMIDLQ